jgi:hypothetical protein
LGAGAALPVTFEADTRTGRLLVATDGLLKYASLDKIASVARQGKLETAARNLVDLVRLRGRLLRDDVALILCKIQKS